MDFILTIDTEGDNQWELGRELTVENIKYIPRFQNLCNKYNILPTYLVTSEVCEDGFAKEIFTDYLLSGKAEIGAHLHSWTTPPFENEEGYRFNDQNHGFATELSEYLLNEKIKNLTNQIAVSFGTSPTSFRSGRYGFNENIAKVLIENSYLDDSSVTPYTNWSSQKGIPNGIGGPDFMDHNVFPYKYRFDNSSLIEIPITILPSKFPLNRNETIARQYFRNVDKSIFLRLIRKLIFNNQPLWLRPYNWMNISLFDEILDEAARRKLPFLVMMFHSSELMPGCSIYRPDTGSIDKLYELLELFFVLLQNKNIKSSTLTAAAQSSTI